MEIQRNAYIQQLILQNDNRMKKFWTELKM